MNSLIIGILLAFPIPVNAQAEEIKPLTLQEKVEQTFNDPRMLKVIQCESQWRQFHNEKPLISPTSDVGLLQINQIHWKRAKELGLDIFNSVDDNLKMAKIIYDEQGITAWTCFNVNK